MEGLLLCAAVAVAGAAGLSSLGVGYRAAIRDESLGSPGHSIPAGRPALSAQAGWLSRARDAAEAARLPAEGAMHGAESHYWNLTREGTAILGGQRALLLQIAEPGVAAGVAKFSNFKAEPLKRLMGTLDSMISISFRTPEERAATLARLEKIHGHVNGNTPHGDFYSALDPELQLWVHSTLVDTALEIERRFRGRFTDVDRAKYYEESKDIARAFKIPEELIPEDYAAFQRYMARKIAALEPSDQAKDIAASLLRPEIGAIPSQTFVPLEWVTNDVLPANLSRAYGMKPLSARQRMGVRALGRFTRNAMPVGTSILFSNRLTQDAAFLTLEKILGSR